MTILTCDLCETPDETAEVTTLRFGWTKGAYELDVCGPHATEVKTTISGWAAKGRPAGTEGPAPGRARRAASSTRPDKAQIEAIRRWARDNGYAVTDRGRVPERVMDAFQAGHGTPGRRQPTALDSPGEAEV